MFKFTLEGALEARLLIDECYDQSYKAYLISAEQGNKDRERFWKERLDHLRGELNKIDRTIIENKGYGQDKKEAAAV